MNKTLSAMNVLVSVLNDKPWPKAPRNVPHCKFQLDSDDVDMQAWLSEANDEFSVLLLRATHWEDLDKVSLVVYTKGEIFVASQDDEHAKLSFFQVQNDTIGADGIRQAVASLVDNF